jgi:uncharacterized membrane protein
MPETIVSEGVRDTPNAELQRRARNALQGKWWPSVGIVVIYTVLTGGASSVPRIGWLISLLISGPLTLGLCFYFLGLARGKSPQIGVLFDGFTRFSQALITYLLMMLYILLWSLLLIIPGIIAALSYSQTFFILTDNPTIEPGEAITQSKKMMMGNKGKLFLLGLRFIGWFILSVLTLGIGFFWLLPYMQTSFAFFYEDIRAARAAQSFSGF